MWARQQKKVFLLCLRQGDEEREGGMEGEDEGHRRMKVKGEGGGEGIEKKSEKTLKILVGAVVPGEYSRQAADDLHGETTLGMLTGP